MSAVQYSSREWELLEKAHKLEMRNTQLEGELKYLNLKYKLAKQMTRNDIEEEADHYPAQHTNFFESQIIRSPIPVNTKQAQKDAYDNQTLDHFASSRSDTTSIIISRADDWEDRAFGGQMTGIALSVASISERQSGIGASRSLNATQLMRGSLSKRYELPLISHGRRVNSLEDQRDDISPSSHHERFQIDTNDRDQSSTNHAQAESILINRSPASAHENAVCMSNQVTHTASAKIKKRDHDTIINLQGDFPTSFFASPEPISQRDPPKTRGRPRGTKNKSKGLRHSSAALSTGRRRRARESDRINSA